ncbi:agmatinase [Candidatus Micrarchaeota archaeon CG10_big_fil_rev_8_21_14_0_10_45_29]|nr:MAG: agmatinase [Candidatus Micrarchaeota archaeon CG10_big_fil_rev_8_21_14_0_10_45_29]
MEDDTHSLMGFAYPYANSKAVILQAPYEKTASYLKGQASAPAAIIKASCQVETYDIELQNDFIDKVGFHTLPPLQIENLPPEKAVDALEQATSKILADGKFPIILGGEHSLTTGAVRACKKKHADLCVLQIDAHADMREEYENSKYSHASVMARVREICPAVSVGIRSYSKEEAKLIGEKYPDVIFDSRIKGKENIILSKIKEKNVYITIDADGFDPSIMPGVGTPEPGGLLWDETLSLLKKVCAEKNIVGFDIVELMPIPSNAVSDFTCAKLAYKLAGYCLL